MATTTGQTNTITPDQLKPVEPIKTVTTPTDTTNYAGMTGGVADSILNEYTNLNNQLTKQQESQNQTGTSIIDSMNALLGKTTDIQTANEQTGVNTETANLTKYAEQLAGLNAQASALNREAQAIPIQTQQNLVSQGRIASDVGIAPENAGALRLNALKALSIAQQSDIAAAAATGSQLRLQAAKDKAQQIVDLKYKPLEDALAIKKQQYELNKDLLSSLDKKRAEALNLAIKKEETAISDAKKEAQAVQDLAFQGIQMGAPAELAQKAGQAKTKLEAAQILGKYAKDLDIELKKAQIAKTWADAKKVDTTSGTLTDADIKRIDTSPQGKKLVSLSGLYQKSQTYQNLVNQYGFKATGNAKALLDSAYADLKIAYKEAANLGALTGPDVSIIEEAIKPTSGGAAKYLSYKLSGGQGGVSGAIEQSLSKARTEALNNYKQLTSRNSKYAGSEYTRSLISPFAKQYSTVNIDTVPKGEIIETEDGILLESLGDGQFSPL